MAVWIWGIILLLVIFCLSLYIKAEVTINIQEDESFQGLRLKIHSHFYKMNRQYDYTDPNLRLVESFLVSNFHNKKNHPPTTTSPDYKGYLSILKGFPIRNIVKHSLENGKILAWVLRFLIVDRLEWKSTVGSQDALYTALGTGACWAVKGAFIGALSSRCRLGRLVLDVRPDFVTPAFFSTFTCILKMRTVHIMIIEIYMAAIKVRWCKYGSRTGTGTVQPSH